MRNASIILVLFLLCQSAIAQTITKQVIGASGKTLTNSNLKLSYTIGEPVVGLMTAGGKQLSNGYYPALNLQTLSVEDNTIDVQLKVYPNPTSNLLYVTHPECNSFRISIADLNGKLLYQSIINKEKPLNVSNYIQGLYLVTIENTTTKKKNTYKIIKK